MRSQVWARSPIKTAKYTFLSLILISFSVQSPTVQAKRKTKTSSRREQGSDAIRYAQEMIQEGQKLLKRRKYRQAIPFFERSQRRVPDVKNLYTLGAIYKKLKNCPKALDYWSLAQKNCDDCGLSTQIDQALLNHTKSCSIGVSIQSLPRALVLLDGERFGETPYTGRLLLGAHKLELRSQGHIPYVQYLQVNKGSAVTLDIVLKPVGQQLGLAQNTPKQNPAQKLRNPSLNGSMPPAIQEAVPAEEWFRAEEVANTQSKQSKIQIIVASTGVAMGLSALGLYAYSLYEYNNLLEIKQNNALQNLSLANQADKADSMQTTSRFLAVLSAISLGSLFFID